jgi:hypothetical protein
MWKLKIHAVAGFTGLSALTASFCPIILKIQRNTISTESLGV